MTETAARSGPRSSGREEAESELAGDLCKRGDITHEGLFFSHVAVDTYELFVAASGLRARSRTKCW